MANGQTTVSASNFAYPGGARLIPAGTTVYFQPCDPNTLQHLSYRAGGDLEGQRSSQRVSFTMTAAGAFSVVLDDTALTDPQNIGYQVTAVDSVGRQLLGPGYVIQPHGANWSFDTDFAPDVGSLALAVRGPAGPAGGVAHYTSGLMVFTGAGSQVITHNLGVLTPSIQANVQNGSSLFTATPVHVNSTRMTVYAAMTATFIFQGGDVAGAAPTVLTDVVPTTDLIAYWQMNEGQGATFADSVGSANLSAATSGDVTWSKSVGFPGLVPTFTSTAGPSGASPATLWDVTKPWTMSFWYTMPGPPPDYCTLMSQADGNGFGWAIRFAVNADANCFQLIFGNAGSGAWLYMNSADTAWTPHVLRHLVVTYDGSAHAAGVNFYMEGAPANGGLVRSDALPNPGIIAGGNLYTVGGPFGSPFNGLTMANVRAYKTALTAQQVATLYTAGPTGQSS